MRTSEEPKQLRIVFPEEYKVVGVIVATIITTLLICDVVEPYVIYKNVFGKSPKMYYIRNYAYTGLFAGCLLVMNLVMRNTGNEITGFFVNGVISVGVSIAALGLVCAVDRGFRNEVEIALGKARRFVYQRIH